MASSLDPREAEDTKTGPAAGDGEKPQQHVSSAATASSSWEADREMVVGSTAVFVDKVAERSYVRKLDFYLLPMMSLMYFFNSVDRSNLGNAKTDGMDKDLGFVGEQYSLLILLFYVPNGLCDLPLNMLTKRAFEAGFFAGAVFYLTLFYTRGELGFRIAIFFGSAMTVVVALVAFFWLPASSASAWFLTPAEKAAALARTRRDASGAASEEYDVGAMFRSWRSWKFIPWCVISFTYPVAFATVSNFLPQIVARLGYSTIKTNLWTVAPNAVGFCFLLLVTWSSDRLRERTFHIIFSLAVSLAGLIILAAIDPLARPAVAYAATFLLAAGAYIPSCLVHSWHNNNNLSENARAATTGLLVGLGNLGGILSAATFRTEYAPAYIPTLVATACCNVTCMIFTLGLGGWMKWENRRRDRLMGSPLVQCRDASFSASSAFSSTCRPRSHPFQTRKVYALCWECRRQRDALLSEAEHRGEEVRFEEWKWRMKYQSPQAEESSWGKWEASSGQRSSRIGRMSDMIKSGLRKSGGEKK
ncbi:MFS transporter [Lasiodiplodia theobromae]|uniref:MFS transporter n=1 Tax=Lasiodiplodia theobromae TaxID=45133 RepID=UPI0015C324CB|nr:MFS transporter [Lasiodiplodia theobromae]KAF4537095.1 MFS transporter [Lasiodiplodia theobromae]